LYAAEETVLGSNRSVADFGAGVGDRQDLGKTEGQGSQRDALHLFMRNEPSYLVGQTKRACSVAEEKDLKLFGMGFPRRRLAAKVGRNSPNYNCVNASAGSSLSPSPQMRRSDALQ